MVPTGDSALCAELSAESDQRKCAECVGRDCGVVLTAWGLTGLADVTELLVSELTANVVRASTGPDGNPRYDNEGKLPLLWVRLLSDHFRIMVEVWDNLPPALGTPVVRHPGPDEESGRGLEMIDVLSEDWGWESVPGWKGKRVWAVLLAPQYQD